MAGGDGDGGLLDVDLLVWRAARCEAVPSQMRSPVEPQFVLRWMRASTVPDTEPPRPSCRTRAQTIADPAPAGKVTMLPVGLNAFSVSTASAFQTTRAEDSACEAV
jgi:hypothetical protein